MPKHKPSVLFVYFTYTKQTLKVVEAMSEVLERRGCDVHRAVIEFDDPRYAKRFETFPMPHPFREVLGMIPAELRRRPAKIGIPAAVTEREYDLVVIGSPTWWLSTNVPIRSFLESDVAVRVLDQRRFAGIRRLPPLLEAQPQDGEEARGEARRSLPRRHPFPIPGRPSAVAVVVAQLPRFRSISRALPRGEDPADQPAGASPRAGERVRRRIGGSVSRNGDRGRREGRHVSGAAINRSELPIRHRSGA